MLQDVMSKNSEVRGKAWVGAGGATATGADVTRGPRFEFDSDPVESVDHSSHGSKVALACLDQDAQGDELKVIWDLELATEIVDHEAWRKISSQSFDGPRYFAAFIRTLRWHSVTAADSKLFQSPFRTGISLHATSSPRCQS